ncbi:MAG: AbrB/MazE/SpoVT family DNA-binding domain-containing protein [Deltaproteobacteria bacterium]|nr:AbrB/MazE/SpoVT family DNA-binding domain-containing protein [Deltaproteobacteria bacterium]
MKGKIQKWGNSLALRIPKLLAAEAQVVDGSEIDLQLKDENIVIVPVQNRPKLKALLEKITAENVHEETGTGDPQGGEDW